MTTPAGHGTLVVEEILRRILGLLWENLSADGTVSDYQAIKKICRLARASKVRDVGGTFLGATLRAVRRVVLDDGQTPRRRIGELWRILDVPPVTEALGLDPDGRLIAGRRPPAVIERRRIGRAPVGPPLPIGSGRPLPPAAAGDIPAGRARSRSPSGYRASRPASLRPAGPCAAPAST